MKTYKIEWQLMERGSHDGRQIYSRTFGTAEVPAVSKAAALEAFREKHPTAPVRGRGFWYKVLAVTVVG